MQNNLQVARVQWFINELRDDRAIHLYSLGCSMREQSSQVPHVSTRDGTGGRIGGVVGGRGATSKYSVSPDHLSTLQAAVLLISASLPAVSGTKSVSLVDMVVRGGSIPFQEGLARSCMCTGWQKKHTISKSY